MELTPLELLKFNLQEKEYPYFEDKELYLLLAVNDNDVLKAAYKGCLLKAAADDEIEVAGIKLSSNREYWLTLAEKFQAESISNGYITNMKRADEY